MFMNSIGSGAGHEQLMTIFPQMNRTREILAPPGSDNERFENFSVVTDSKEPRVMKGSMIEQLSSSHDKKDQMSWDLGLK